MARKKVTVSVDLRVQWTGKPPKFFGERLRGRAKEPPSYPGIQVPLPMAEAVGLLDGVVLAVDPDNYPQSAADEIKALFIAAGRLTVTPNNEEFGPYGLAIPTTSDGKWKPKNADSLAWAVGVRQLKAAGYPDPKAKFTLYEQDYARDGAKLKARFWVAFTLVRSWK